MNEAEQQALLAEVKRRPQFSKERAEKELEKLHFTSKILLKAKAIVPYYSRHSYDWKVYMRLWHPLVWIWLAGLIVVGSMMVIGTKLVEAGKEIVLQMSMFFNEAMPNKERRLLSIEKASENNLT